MRTSASSIKIYSIKLQLSIAEISVMDLVKAVVAKDGLVEMYVIGCVKVTNLMKSQKLV